MTRQRLRPAHDPATLAGLYNRPYRSLERGDDHVERVAVTAGLAAGLIRRHRLTSLADLSCGAGEIPRTVAALCPNLRLWLGDYTAADGLDVVGPIEDTLTSFHQVDLFVCSETLEHLDNPHQVLRGIRQRARWLVLTTPLAAWGDPNLEHYWAWDDLEVRGMLLETDWRPRTWGTLRPEPGYYTFQLWAAN